MARMDISGRQSLMFFSQFINIQVKRIWASSFAGRLFKFSMFSHFNWCSAQVHLFFNTLKSKKIWLRVSWCQEEIKLWSNCGILQRGSPETFLYKSISILFRYNTLHLSNWSSEVVTIIAEYQTEVIAAAERGFDGKDIPGEKTNIIWTFRQHSLLPDNVWNFSGALLYSLTVITTIGRLEGGPVTVWQCDGWTSQDVVQRRKHHKHLLSWSNYGRRLLGLGSPGPEKNSSFEEFEKYFVFR